MDCEKDRESYKSRQFQIRYDKLSKQYKIKDLGVGLGVFTECIGKTEIEDNMLINMGESFILVNLVTTVGC